MPTVMTSLLKPRRKRLWGLPPSIIQRSVVPSSICTSMWIQAWGLIHSTRATVPWKWIGRLASNSAENA